ncbi:SDR family NAD(P)-dependent oxidoreductase, partial [Pelagibacteraceae bacterium]|nr:SDR family NAD(P)-dependent oxidoreductase [Pelagibacteraceae bacterium]
MFDKFKLDSKVAIVTGGTRGIGLAIARALGEAGAKLIVTSRTDKYNGFESLKKSGFNVTFYESDITDPSVPQKIIDNTIKENNRLDILVNNAGVAQHGDIETYNDNLLNKIMNTNVD